MKKPIDPCESCGDPGGKKESRCNRPSRSERIFHGVVHVVCAGCKQSHKVYLTGLDWKAFRERRTALRAKKAAWKTRIPKPQSEKKAPVSLGPPPTHEEAMATAKAMKPNYENPKPVQVAPMSTPGIEAIIREFRACKCRLAAPITLPPDWEPTEPVTPKPKKTISRFGKKDNLTVFNSGGSTQGEELPAGRRKRA